MFLMKNKTQTFRVQAKHKDIMEVVPGQGIRVGHAHNYKVQVPPSTSFISEFF